MNTIKLTHDEYGYHTMALRCRLSQQEYERVTKSLFALSKEKKEPIIYPIRQYSTTSHRCYCSSVLSKHGILLYFTKNKAAPDGTWKWTVKAVVNPRKVLDPNSSYLGIMSNRDEALEELVDGFTRLMRGIGLPDQLDEWRLIRLDLCVNLQCGQKKTAREYLRLLNKDSYRGHWTRSYYANPQIPLETEMASKKEMRKKDREKNKHYIQLENDTLTIVVYDKGQQMEWEGLCGKGERLHKGVLRVEIRCGRRYLKHMRKENDIHSTMEQLAYMSTNSRELMLKQIRRAFPAGGYGKIDILYDAIEGSGYHAKVKEQLKYLCTIMRRKKRLEDGLNVLAETYDLSKVEIEYRVQQFKKLSVNPIPVTESFYLPRLPALVEVLEQLEDGSSAFVIDEAGTIQY